MPWTVANPPNPVKNRPEREKRACVIAANDTLARGGSEAEAIQACIGAARKVRRGRRLQDERRLGKKARIKRATAAARERLPEIDAEAAAQLEQIYRRAADELDRRIRSLADPTDGTLRSWILPQLREQVGAVVSSTAAERDQVLRDFIDEAARAGVAPLAAETAIEHVRVAEEAARFVRTFQAEDGLTLSDRLWRLDRGAQETLEGHIQRAVVVGDDASRAAQDFLERGEDIPSAVRQQIREADAGRVAQSAAQRFMTGERSPHSQALQVFRTEINRAHGEAYMAGAFDVEGVIGMRFRLSPNHPRPDICDMHASVDRHGLGPGVYPRGQVPWPAHPNTLSYVEAVFDDEIESDTSEPVDPVDWLKQQPVNVQHGVLNSRHKVGALQAGILRPNEIGTPWRVLRQRYASQGINENDLLSRASIPEPGAASIADVVRRSRENILESGRSNGTEFAAAVDHRTGAELFRHTTGSATSVNFTPDQLRMLRDPQRSVELIHNHPSSSSLSRADLRIGTLGGIRSVVALGHDGAIYSGRQIGRSATFNRAYVRAERWVHSHLAPRVNRRELSIEYANRAHHHLVNSLLARGGYIEYEVERASDGHNRALNAVGDAEVRRILEEYNDD